MKNKTNSEELLFTGERMIPKINKGNTFYYEHIVRYLMASQWTKGKTVLDIGCGVGYGSWILKKLGAKMVTGIDLSKEAIKYATFNYKTGNVNFELGNAENLPSYKKKFDVLIAYELIEHIQNQNLFLEGVKNNLNKNGLFIVSTPNKLTYKEDNPFHVRELSPEELEVLMKQFFKFVYLFDQRFLFSNLITPIHSKADLKLEKMKEAYVKEDIESFMPINKLENSRYFVAFCSDSEINAINSFSLSTLDVDIFSLKDGIEGMYKMWNESNGENEETRQQLNEIIDSKFFKLWQFYCKWRDLIKKKLQIIR